MGTLPHHSRITRVLAFASVAIGFSASARAAENIYLDTLSETKNIQVLHLNPTDLGGESKWDKNPLVKEKKGQEVWLWTTIGTMKAKVDRVVITTREGDFGFLKRGTINIVVKADKPIPAGRVLLSLTALPVQTWTARAALESEIKLGLSDAKTAEGETFNVEPASCTARVIDTKRTSFLIFRYPLANDIVQDRYRTLVYSGDSKASTWMLSKKFDDAMFEPWVDVDGDGIPELVGETGYESFGVKTFYPYSKILQQSTSGI